MCADKSNINALRSNVKPEFCDKSVLVVSDVKNNSFVSNIISRIKDLYHFLHGVETIGGNNIIPKLQGCFGVRVFFPKNFQSFFRYDSHNTKIRIFPKLGIFYGKMFFAACGLRSNRT